MKTRPLNEEEKQAYLKALQRWEEEIKYQQYLVRDADLKITEGLKRNYELSMSKYRVAKRAAIASIQEIQLQMITYNEHLNKGVPQEE